MQPNSLWPMLAVDAVFKFKLSPAHLLVDSAIGFSGSGLFGVDGLQSLAAPAQALQHPNAGFPQSVRVEARCTTGRRQRKGQEPFSRPHPCPPIKMHTHDGAN